MKRSDEVRAAHAPHYDADPPHVCLECDLLREIADLRQRKAKNNQLAAQLDDARLNIKRLESQNYRLNNRCVELEASSAMACESPDPKCDCAGCSLARDVGGAT